MKLAHILPPRALIEVPELVGDYHLLLPSLSSTSAAYRQFYQERATIDYLMLDNGIAEGNRIDFAHQLVAAKVLNVQEVVLPDVMKDMDRTLSAVAQAFYPAFEQRRHFRYMLVAQGSSIIDCASTVERAMNMFPGMVHTIGIPRHILSRHPDARLMLAARLQRFGKQIHLLGMHPEHPWEIKNCSQAYDELGVRGVDTSMAWNATLQGIQLSGAQSLNYNLIIERQPIGDFAVAVPTPAQLALLRENMETMNEWLTK
jgi:hypothetical protein